VVVVLDADSAGRKAALRTAELLIEEGLAVSLATLPSGEDPDSLILKTGPEAFAAVLEGACSPMGFLLGMFKERGELETQEGMLRATRAVLELATHAQGAVQAEQMLREAAAGLQVGYTALREDLRRAQRMKSRPVSSTGAGEIVPPVSGPERPVDEVELASLLCSGENPAGAAFVRRWLPYPLISDPACRTIIQILAEEEEELMSALDDASDDCKTLAAKIANAPCKIAGWEEDEYLLKAAQDLVLRIWRRHLEAQRAGISRRMQTLEGPERQRLLHEMAELLLDLGKFKRGWATASVIIDQYLQRMVEA
jgi:DNA primase